MLPSKSSDGSTYRKLQTYSHCSRGLAFIIDSCDMIFSLSRLFEQLTRDSIPAKETASVGLQVSALKEAAAGKVALIVCDDMFVLVL